MEIEIQIPEYPPIEQLRVSSTLKKSRNKTMCEKVKNSGRSIRAKLLNIGKQENIFFQTILTRYFQERLLYRMSLTQYKEHFS